MLKFSSKRSLSMIMSNYVFPREPEMHSFVSSGIQGSVCMLNFIKFREHARYRDGKSSTLTGREAYSLYGNEMVPHCIRHGGRLVFSSGVDTLLLGKSGNVEPWDYIGIMEYPSIPALLEMTKHDKQFFEHRLAGLEGQVLLTTIETCSPNIPRISISSLSSLKCKFASTVLSTRAELRRVGLISDIIDTPSFEVPLTPNSRLTVNDIETYIRSCPHSRPIQVVHLLKIKPLATYSDDRPTSLTGEQAEGLYMSEFRSHLARVGGKIVFNAIINSLLIGRLQGGELWDRVIVTEYPSKEAFREVHLSSLHMEFHRDASTAGQILFVCSKEGAHL
jgi:hypothetical protein